MLRYNQGKPPLSLIPTAFLLAINGTSFLQGPTRLIEDVAHVLGFGAKKYSPNNWRKGGSWLSVLDCALRHIMKYNRGETHDDESGIHHLAHAGCNIAFLLEFISEKTSVDDRYITKEPWLAEDHSGLEEVVQHLISWKDGGQNHEMHLAARKLALFYETLTTAPVVSGMITAEQLIVH